MNVGMATVYPADEMLSKAKIAALGLQHVLVMYVGAIAVPLIIGRALKLSPEQVSQLISADLFCCGLISILQSLGVGRFVGIRLPVMMGVTFAAVGSMISIGLAAPWLDGLRTIFGVGTVAGLFGIIVAPFADRLISFFPPIVTGTVIVEIGISLMKVGINWIFGLPFDPTAPQLVNLEHTKWLSDAAMATQVGSSIPAPPADLKLVLV